MLVRKSVTISDGQMHLRDEADNYVQSYDRAQDGEMCAFLDRMIALDLYELRCTGSELPLSVAA